MREIHTNDLKMLELKNQLVELFKDGYIEVSYMGMTYKTSFRQFMLQVQREIKFGKIKK